MKTRMKDFRLFLDTKEVELSKTTDFLTDWVNDLKVRLKSYLKNFIPIGKNQLIYDLFLNFVDGNRENKINMIQQSKL